MCVSDRHSTNEAKKCHAIRVGAMEVAKDAAFKRFCIETLGTAISDFMPQELGVRKSIVKIKALGYILGEIVKGNSFTPADRHCGILAISEWRGLCQIPIWRGVEGQNRGIPASVHSGRSRPLWCIPL